MVETYQATMLVATPTFLSGIARSASDKQLASLRLAVVGAEKCPDSLYKVLERRWPKCACWKATASPSVPLR
jgi:phenylacetate-coenzyme A ligase PaaK-like adenylate-forming protein